jgi:xylan 1,4-beta-xylosidase
VDRLIAHCHENKVPLDFVSTHVYGNDTSKDVFGTDEVIPRSDMVARAMRKVRDQVKASTMPNIPIIWSEFNASFFNERNVTDAPFMGPWLANHIRQSDGLADEVSFWTFSDVFEEGGVVRNPLYGGFGLIAAGSIPKAAFNAFKLLHALGDQRLPIESDSVLATKFSKCRKKKLAVVAWNYAAPEEAGSKKTLRLKFEGVKPKAKALVTILDKNHGSAQATWEKMGRPDFPTREQQEELRSSAELPEPVTCKLDKDSELTLDSLALIEFVRKGKSRKKRRRCRKHK